MRVADVPILMYHCVNDALDDSPLGFLGFTTEEFRAHLRYLTCAGFQCVTLRELFERVERNHELTEPLAVLTFDDGYLDNLLCVEPILEEFGARGTVFVNTGFVTDGPIRKRESVRSPWGYLNRAELKEMQDRGTLDIQSHTISHDMVFCSDRVIDFYDPAKAGRYFWLPWLLNPAVKPTWLQDRQAHAESVPTGYPIFEHDRALRARRFMPSDAFVAQAIARYQATGRDALAEANESPNKGRHETDDEREQRLLHELRDSRAQLQDWLDKPVDFLCFPGGGYDEVALKLAGSTGYRAYMRNSRENPPGNLARIQAKRGNGEMVPLSRVSITRDYSGKLRGARAAYWSCKWRVESFLQRPLARTLLTTARGLRNFTRRITGRPAS